MPYPLLNSTPQVTTHAQAHNMWVDVKAHFGATGDGTTEDHAAIQAAVAAAVAKGGGTVYFPKGTYKLGVGQSIPLASGVHYIGESYRNTVILSNGAYCFYVNGATSNVYIKNFGTNSWGAESACGAIKFGGSGGHNSTVIDSVYAEFDSTEPIFYFNDIIGAVFTNMHAGGQASPVGFYFSLVGGFVNANTLFKCRAINGSNQQTWNGYNGGLIMDGGNGNAIRDCIFESNRYGYGILLNGTEGTVIEDCWFEDNGYAHVKTTGNALRTNITGCQFHHFSQNVTVEGAVSLQTSTPSLRCHDYIGFNQFTAIPPSGKGISIGANVQRARVIGNRFPAFATSTWKDDQGEATAWVLNDNAYVGDVESWGVVYQVANTSTALKNGFQLHNGAARNTNENSNPRTRMFAAGDLTNAESGTWVGVTSEGHLEIHSLDGPTVNVLQTSGFSPFWDGSVNRPRMHFRNSGGGATGEMGFVVNNGTQNITFQNNSNATTPGSVVKKLPIYDGATLLGYIPIYDAIT